MVGDESLGRQLLFTTFQRVGVTMSSGDRPCVVRYDVISWPCVVRYDVISWPCVVRYDIISRSCAMSYDVISWPCVVRYDVISWPCAMRYDVISWPCVVRVRHASPHQLVMRHSCFTACVYIPRSPNRRERLSVMVSHIIIWQLLHILSLRCS